MRAFPSRGLDDEAWGQAADRARRLSAARAARHTAIELQAHPVDLDVMHDLHIASRALLAQSAQALRHARRLQDERRRLR